MRNKDWAKVVLREEDSLDADDLCAKLYDEARRIGPGSGAVDRLEWRAADVIQQLLRERAEWRKTSDV